MAYLRANDPEPGKYRLLAVNLDGSDENILRVTKSTRGGDPSYLTWSHDGKQIAYSFLSSGAALGYVESFDISKKQVTTLASLANGRVFELKWLPGDRWLLVVFSAKGPHVEQGQIGLLSTDGKLRPISRDTNRYSTLSLSADSRSAATVQVKTNRSLFLLPGGKSSHPVDAKPLQAADPRLVDWTPDGKLLISDGERITRMDADGQNATVLVDDPNAGVFSFSPCGDRYLVLSWAYHSNNTINIWRTNADGSAPKQLTSGYFEVSPHCSPNGKWVYFVDSPTSRLMRVSVDGAAAESVPGSNVPNQFGLTGISFIAEDGKSLGFMVDVIDPYTNDAQSKLAIVNLDAGSNGPARLLQLDPRLASIKAFGTTNVHALPNFAGVAYPISENGVTNLWVQSLDGSPGHQVTHFPSEETSDFHWSPDGKTLAIIREQDVADVVLIREANP